MLKLVVVILFDKLPRQLYVNALLRLPALYSTRVLRILEDAELTMPEVRKLYVPALDGAKADEEVAGGEKMNSKEPSLSIVHFKSTWESFVDDIMHEWNTLNIVSVLLLSYVGRSYINTLSLNLYWL